MNEQNGAEYIEPNKQVLVVIGGVTFYSLPVGTNGSKAFAGMRKARSA